MLGQVVDGKYEILSLIGEGGMGAVYRSRHKTTGREAAVKVISSEDVARNETLIARFEREAQAAAKIRSPHIVEILDAGHDASTGHPYMVMELLVGMNVHRLLRQLGPLPAELAIRIAIQTCFGLEKAHAVGVVHRDIKPANLFVAEADGGERVIKLLDFGVAKFKMDQASESSDGLTRTGSVLGSPMFMSPEQARGLKTIDHRADIWSLGIVLYQLLSGKTPHSGIDGVGELIITICSEEPAPLRSRAPWVSPTLERVVHKALKLPAADRYQSAAEMRDALAACLADPAAWHIHQRMLVPLTDDERAAKFDDDSGVEADDAATVALDPNHVELGGSDASESTVALDEGAPLPPASPFDRKTPTPAAGLKEPGEPKPAPAAQSKWIMASADPRTQTGERTQGDGSAARAPIFIALALGIALGVAALGFLFYRAKHQHEAAAPTASTTTAVSTSPSASNGAGDADPVALPAPSASSGANLAGARLKVTPLQARVLVDGKQVERASDGTVALDGAVGSSHTVAIHWGAGATYKQVVLTDKGPVPAELIAGTDAPVGAVTAAPSAAPPFATAVPSVAPKIQF